MKAKDQAPIRLCEHGLLFRGTQRTTTHNTATIRRNSDATPIETRVHNGNAILSSETLKQTIILNQSIQHFWNYCDSLAGFTEFIQKGF